MAIEIIKKSDNLTSVMMYGATISPAIKRMQDYKGVTLDVDGYVYFRDVKENDENAVDILSIVSGADAYATNSATFISSFFQMMDFFATCGQEVHAVTIEEGVSKAGRSFIQCVYAG